MPQSIPCDWPAIAALAASGHTLEELAVRFGVNLNTLKARCRRGGWKQISKTVQAQRVDESVAAGQMVATASSGVAVVHETMVDLGNDTKLHLAKSVNKAAVAAAELQGPEALKAAKQIKETVGSATTLHGWDNSANGNNVMVNVLIQG